ncbi:transcription factor ATF2 [Metarhizium rileyi]|uniref:Transcription factor ATF2 n=1 Tax=Metarhizium rileyi (strain RCEF 4871) TaxID=1649241 RepID=A0A167C0S5_METRR|nr:transcription factor ATF2 [Metarhizium rileyi RCEF 4871]
MSASTSTALAVAQAGKGQGGHAGGSHRQGGDLVFEPETCPLGLFPFSSSSGHNLDVSHGENDAMTALLDEFSKTCTTAYSWDAKLLPLHAGPVETGLAALRNLQVSNGRPGRSTAADPSPDSNGTCSVQQKKERQTPQKKTRKDRDLKRDRRDRSLERNRQAAFKSRRRKKQWTEDLEEKKYRLEQTHRQLQANYICLLEESSQLKNLLIGHASCHEPNIDMWISNEASKFARKPSGEIGQQPASPQFSRRAQDSASVARSSLSNSLGTKSSQESTDLEDLEGGREDSQDGGCAEDSVNHGQSST